MALSKS